MGISVKPRKAKFLNYFERGFAKIKDPIGRAAIAARIKRAAHGNFGDYKHLQEGVYELRIDTGPGYRIYFGIGENDTLIILIVVGSKRTQSSDIEKAIKIWRQK